PSAKGDDKFITTDYLQQCRRARSPTRSVNAAGASRVQPHDLVMVFFMALSLIVLANCCH
ncbi:hypothetical protein, partial [Klebsiella pneumoniae]|uniref:hypothetical protein n=1 Tax=Klebsiella pneumoniae TaxID=573 RepID=UPI0019671B37